MDVMFLRLLHIGMATRPWVHLIRRQQLFYFAISVVIYVVSPAVPHQQTVHSSR